MIAAVDEGRTASVEEQLAAMIEKHKKLEQEKAALDREVKATKKETAAARQAELEAKAKLERRLRLVAGDDIMKARLKEVRPWGFLRFTASARAEKSLV